MGDQTAISWTDKTWNPWMGCRKVSQGCKNCYMYRDMAKYGRDAMTVTRSKTTFSAPLHWKQPAKVFTCSWSDFFIAEADEWRDEAWDIIRQTPHLTYQILTKRPELIAGQLPDDWGTGWPNVWLGVSAENQEAADLRIPQLLAVPAAIHFVSAEPLLGPLALDAYLMCKMIPGPEIPWPRGTIGVDDLPMRRGARLRPRLDWVIVGGESGPKARSMDMAWARSIRDQCVATGVALWFKQQSHLKPGFNPWVDEEDGALSVYHQFPEVRSL